MSSRFGLTDIPAFAAPSSAARMAWRAARAAWMRWLSVRRPGRIFVMVPYELNGVRILSPTWGGEGKADRSVWAQVQQSADDTRRQLTFAFQEAGCMKS